MKKVLVLFLSAILLLSTCATGALAMSFTDLAEDHWAYANVQTLVNDGTVSGYEDGSFRPNGTVTRAEFVKMLGKSNVTRQLPYADVTAEHWAFEYVMNANFPDDNSNLFQPNLPITRGLVAELLWKRGGEKTDVFAPSIITSQYKKNPAAAAWVYATGLIRGDGDGINLRLDSTLSRAEAATLIVRSRTATQATGNFNDIVNEDIVKTVYNGLNLFDGAPYVANDTVTNGEMARAVLRLRSEQINLSYAGITGNSANFEHPYAKEVAIVFGNLGINDVNAAFADSAATFGNTVAALSYNFITKSHKGQIYGNKTAALESKVTTMVNVCLTYAKENGIISLKEDLNKAMTVRDFTILCLLFDSVIGSQSVVTTDSHPATIFAMKDHSLLLIPEGYGDYRVMVSNIPSELYQASFNDAVGTPYEAYDFAREYSSLFMSVLKHLQTTVRAKAEVRFNYYPSLVCKNSDGYTMRIGCEIISLNGAVTIGELFPVKAGVAGADTQLTNGSVIYFDLSTGGVFSSVNMSSEKAFVDQIVLVK